MYSNVCKQREEPALRFTQNRELSWLKFNERVLEEAEDETVPLFERLRFLSIYTSNLEEFFMIRAGSLFDLTGVNEEHIDNKTGMTPREQLDKIYEAVAPLYEKRDDVFEKVEQQLRIQGIFSLSYKELGPQEKELVDTYFRDVISPILSPQIVDAHHPFPHLQNKMQHAAALLRTKGDTILGIVTLPETLPEILFFPGDGIRYISTDKILLQHAETIFQMYEVTGKTSLCVTRNADVNWDDEAFDVDDDFRNKMKKLLRKRKRLAVVRLELANEISPTFRSLLCKKFNIEKQQVFCAKAPIRMEYVKTLAGKLSGMQKKELTYPAFNPTIPADITETESMLRQVGRKDLLLFHPYDSMEPFIKLIKEASTDPAVLSIKITIYRLARKAKLVDYLCAAAENGKDVTVLIELRARFDEQNNIDWSERLEEAGCKILYGFGEIKVHSKICLITVREKGKIKYITQIGTGNYNENTAEVYTDLSLITASQQIGEDASAFFNNLAMGNLMGSYSHLLTAPAGLKPGLFNLIDEQIALGKEGRILLKLNSITDIEMINKLSEASCAGVRVDMIVRGICCLLPQVPGKTENIFVTSVVGRFLEHSRIYSFGSGAGQKMYLSSADMMTRNMERRIEAACPIMESEIKQRINRILEVLQYDNTKARSLDAEGNYHRKAEKRLHINSQDLFMKEASSHARKFVSNKKRGLTKITERIMMSVKSVIMGSSK